MQPRATLYPISSSSRVPIPTPQQEPIHIWQALPATVAVFTGASGPELATPALGRWRPGAVPTWKRGDFRPCSPSGPVAPVLVLQDCGQPSSVVHQDRGASEAHPALSGAR